MPIWGSTSFNNVACNESNSWAMWMTRLYSIVETKTHYPWNSHQSTVKKDREIDTKVNINLWSLKTTHQQSVHGSWLMSKDSLLELRDFTCIKAKLCNILLRIWDPIWVYVVLVPFFFILLLASQWIFQYMSKLN